MSPKRIFTFGCSFTNYFWPTWADIILYGNEGYNLAICGGGFDSVLYRIMEADRSYSLTTNDIVIVVFPTPLRWDLIVKQESPIWNGFGQVTTSPNSKYENDLYCLTGLLYRSYYNILLIKDYVEKRNIPYLFGSVNNVFENVGNFFEDVKINDQTCDLMDYIKSNVKIDLLDFYSFVNGNKITKRWIPTKYFEDSADYHPRPKQHYDWIKKILLKHIDLDLKVDLDGLNKIEEHIDSCKLVSEAHPLREMYPEFFNHRVGGGYEIYLSKAKSRRKLI